MLYIIHKFPDTSMEVQTTWQITELLPCIEPANIREIQADEEELRHILAKFSVNLACGDLILRDVPTIPFVFAATSMRWCGDLARTIYCNLP